MGVETGGTESGLHEQAALEPEARLEFERYFLYLRLFLFCTPVFIVLAYGRTAISSAVVDTIAIAVDCSVTWTLLRFRPSFVLRYQLLLRGGDIALGYIVLHSLHAQVGNVYYDSVYVLFVVAAAATHGRRGAVLLSIAAALLVLLGRVQLALEGVFALEIRHITDSLYYAVLFLLAGNTTAFVIRKSREPAVQRALHDPLTDLPNRLLFDDRLSQAIFLSARDRESFALLFVDLDDFKDINDSAGHAAGDALLREVAFRLRATFRESDTVARLGGDEFAVLLPGADSSSAVLAASEIQSALARPIHAGKLEVTIRASIGGSVYPQDGSTPESLVHGADTAMYRAKRTGAGYSPVGPTVSLSR